jgi:hypothetical protein
MSKTDQVDTDRKFCAGDKQMFSARIPTRLLEELKAIAERNGKPVTEVVIDALDSYAQRKAEQRKRR